MRHGDPVVVQTFIGFGIVSEMPFADQSTGIAVFFQNFRKGGEFSQGIALFRANLETTATEEIVNPVLGKHQASEISGTGRGTHRVVGKGIGKTNTLRRHLINVRGANILVAVATQGPCPMVIG